MTLQRMVLDLSHHNTVTDWNAIVYKGAITGIIHKATEGSSYVDNTYAQRCKDARKAGLLWGAYHFLRPGDMEKQAEHFLNVVGDDGETLLAIDHEDPGVPLADLQSILEIITDRTGQRPVIYSGHVLKEQMGAAASPLSKHRLWLAQYSKNPVWPPAWQRPWLWQYSETGSCAGCSGKVDENCFDRSEAELDAEWTGGQPEPPPEPSETSVVTIEITVPRGATVNVIQRREQ
jgi:GH25 family lysozyme M1 (1,4-beta-N-acetylmuramidase)